MALALFFLLFYAGAFLALFVLRRLAWLAVGTVVAIVSIVGLLRLLEDVGGGEGSLGWFIAIVAAAIGAAAGAAARLAVMLLGLRWKDAALTRPIGLLILFGVPLAFAAWSGVKNEQHRKRFAPPSEECRSRIHQVTLGDRDLRLPLVAGVRIGEGRGNSPKVSIVFPENERDFCERAAASRLRLTSVEIDYSHLGDNYEGRPRRVCQRPRDEAWWPVFCRFERTDRMECTESICSTSIASIPARRLTSAWSGAPQTRASSIHDGSRLVAWRVWTWAMKSTGEAHACRALPRPILRVAISTTAKQGKRTAGAARPAICSLHTLLWSTTS
jgi:hypothetical protein